ncbi:transcription elongation factor, mitochondrial isoform X1 [Drosophila pseudoobscura]|uniref:Transcription elongation factor, mitochondrial isoform X1 n=1 Tax=Drosophila pseudoobscura pseudoobscura TaxID=46245 RepID=A0A6I8UAG5_DROPS|nr:transcription elongation factor, mitochondrial isoform X1 [Drosophila pseudoobscura]
MLYYSRALWSLPGKHIRHLSTRVTPVATDNDQANSLLPAYTDEERVKILQTLNDSSIDQMLSYDITKGRASKLHNWRTRNGPLRDVNDILYVEGFGLKVATKFFKSLLEPEGTRRSSEGNAVQKPKSTRTAPFITPGMDEGQRVHTTSSVGVRIGVTSVSWARIEIGKNDNDPCLLTHWQHHELNDKKLHLAELARRCLYVTHQIPQADCYVLENPQMAQASSNPGSIDQQNVNIQKSQVTAIMSYALLSRGDPDETKCNNLYYMRRFLTARLFNHLVGTERVSSEDTILSMMRTHYNMEDQTDTTPQAHAGIRNLVQFPADLRNMFSQQERYQRELLGQAFLLNLAFARLVLLQDPLSISTVSRSPKTSLLSSADGCEAIVT